MTADLSTLLAGVILAGLAGYRSARAVTVDALVEGLRDRIEDWAWTVDRRFVNGVHVEEVVPRGHTAVGRLLRGKTGDLFTCPQCLGFWTTAAAWWAWAEATAVELEPVAHLVVVMAAAGVQSAVQSFTDRAREAS